MSLLRFQQCLLSFVFAAHASAGSQPQTAEALIATLCSTPFPLFPVYFKTCHLTLCLEICSCEHPFLASSHITAWPPLKTDFPYTRQLDERSEMVSKFYFLCSFCSFSGFRRGNTHFTLPTWKLQALSARERNEVVIHANLDSVFYLFIFNFVCVFFSFIFISWRLITSQHFSGFCHTLTWISLDSLF